jgi:hypothetical protein
MKTQSANQSSEQDQASPGRHSVNRPVGRVGMYRCNACGEYIERESNDGKTLKKWRKSYCEKTGKNVRIWLKLWHGMPHRHFSPNASDQRHLPAKEDV